MSTRCQETCFVPRPARAARLGLAALLALVLALVATDAVLAGGSCTQGKVAENGDGVAQLPPIHLPFSGGESWTVGGGGSYFGEWYHCNAYSDYYATDWNRSGDEGRAVYPVAAGVVSQVDTNCGGDLGCLVRIVHRLGDDRHDFESTYAHLQAGSITLVPGDVVMPWTQLGRVGNTGQSSGAHLHLSLKSRSGSSYWSRCAQGVSGGLCRNLEGTRTPQARRLGRVWRQGSNGTMTQGASTDGASFTSGNQPRIYFPGVLNKSGSWDTNLHIRNNHGGTNHVTVYLYDLFGNFVTSSFASLGSNASWRYSFSQQVVGGTAVVVAEVGKDIAAVSRLKRTHANGDHSYAATEGIEQPLAEHRIPVVHRDNYGWGNRIFLHNPNHGGSVHTRLDYSNGCSRSITIGAGDTAEINTTHESCLPLGWAGSLKLSTTRTGSSSEPAVIAVSSLQELRSGGDRPSLSMASMSRPGGRTLFLPLVHNDNFNIFAGLGAEREQGSGSLVGRYDRASGAACITSESYSTWPVIVAPVPTSNASSCGSVLSGRLEASGSTDYVTAQFNQNDLSNRNTSTYPAVADPTWLAYVPMLESGTTQGIQVQNASTAWITVTVTFYTQGGGHSGTRTKTLAPRASWTLGNGSGTPSDSRIPSTARNARVSATGNVAVVVNNIQAAGARDKLMDYTAPGRL